MEPNNFDILVSWCEKYYLHETLSAQSSKSEYLVDFLINKKKKCLMKSINAFSLWGTFRPKWQGRDATVLSHIDAVSHPPQLLSGSSWLDPRTQAVRCNRCLLCVQGVPSVCFTYVSVFFCKPTNVSVSMSTCKGEKKSRVEASVESLYKVSR